MPFYEYDVKNALYFNIYEAKSWTEYLWYLMIGLGSDFDLLFVYLN